MKNNISTREQFVRKVRKYFKDAEKLIERAINKANDETAEKILKRGPQEACWSGLLAVQKVEKEELDGSRQEEATEVSAVSPGSNV